MAGKCKEMNKIKQALRFHLDGESNRSIGRKLDLYKGIVNKYITLAESCGILIPVFLSMEEPKIERMLTGGNPAYSDSRFQDLKERLLYIASELERKYMTMFLLWREYRTNNPDGYGCTRIVPPHRNSSGGSDNKTYKHIWAMFHKLRIAMGKRDERYTLEDMVELDEGSSRRKCLMMGRESLSRKATALSGRRRPW